MTDPTGQAAPGPRPVTQRHRSVLLSRLRPPADTARDALVDELRSVLLSGDVPPGTAIPVAEVAGHFGVSHIPVREALKTLAAEQLVEHRRNSGYAVATLTWAELRELYVVRGVLEAAALAGAVALAEEADDAALAAALAALDGAIRDRDHRAYHRETRRFHFAMLDPCRMSRLLHVLRSVWNLTEPYQSMAHITDANRARLHAEHARMCAAFMARDAAALARLADDHQHDLETSIAGLPADGRLFADPARRLRVR